MIESIEKLRKWVKSLYTPNSGELKVEGLDIADEIEAEIESRYMELPVDADGVPIHPNDKLRACGRSRPIHWRLTDGERTSDRTGRLASNALIAATSSHAPSRMC